MQLTRSNNNNIMEQLASSLRRRGRRILVEEHDQRHASVSEVGCDRPADKSAGLQPLPLPSDSSSDYPPPLPPASNSSSTINPRLMMSPNSIRKDESRARKIITRIISGVIMISLFIGIILSGHVYVCALVFVLEVLLFRELVTVRYHCNFDRIDRTIPLFRTTQWMWFFVAIFYTYSEFAVEMIKNNTKLHDLLEYAQLAPMLAFSLYTGTFVLTIATMQTGHIRFQLNQLCWTILVLCLTVGQCKYIMHNIYNGLIWFTLPILLVITNDIMAYFSGITFGRKFIHRPFIELSPNKTWEGFIGGGIFTLIVGFYLSRFLAKFTWMTCATNQFALFPEKLECEVENIFHEATIFFPPQVFDLCPNALIRLLPNVVEICSVGGNTDNVTACVAGAVYQKHHHYELALGIIPIQFHAISLSLFASLVSPFGGFLASAIKRAYGIKDFDSLIPGHGGLMDRFDCQLIMALGTWVHYNTFVKTTTVSVAKMLYMYKLLGDDERRQFLEKISEV